MNLLKKIPGLNIIKKDHIQKPYNTIADVYFDKHFDEKSFDKYIDKFASLLPKKSNVLDIGCGPGGETKKLIKKGLDVTGIDISNKMLKKARENVSAGKFIHMDLMNMSFGDKCFDGIWSARTLIHVPKKYLVKTLAGFQKVLKQNGIICLIVLGGKGEGVEPEYYDPTGKTSCFFKYFEKNELDKILTKLNFKIIVSDYYKLETEPYIAIIAEKN